MRQVTRKGLVTMAAAGGVLALSGGSAYADAVADGDAVHSPGVLSGNTVEVPVNAQANICGNTVSVVGLLNPAAGNACVNEGGAGKHGQHEQRGGQGQGQRDTRGQGTTRASDDDSRGTSGQHSDPRAANTHQDGGSSAHGEAVGSPGVLSGNVVQAPVDLSANVCGNSVSVIGLLNPAGGNECVNESGKTERHEKPTPDKPEDTPHQTPEPNTPNTTTETPETDSEPVLAQTGSPDLGVGIGVGAGLLLGGTVLYRRARSARQR